MSESHDLKFDSDKVLGSALSKAIRKQAKSKGAIHFRRNDRLISRQPRNTDGLRVINECSVIMSAASSWN